MPTMICRECGCEVPAGASRCPRCGAPVPAADGTQGKHFQTTGTSKEPAPTGPARGRHFAPSPGADHTDGTSPSDGQAPQDDQPARGRHFAPSPEDAAGRPVLADDKPHGAQFASSPASPEAPAPTQARPAGEKARRRPRWARLCLGLAAFVAVVLALTAALRAFVVGTYVVPSASMADTIEVGDLVASEKVSYRFGEPEAGDIVTFTVYAQTVDGEPVAGTISLEPGEGLEEVELVKRVIATAGQTVDIVDGAVYVDGEPLEEDYVDGALTEELAGSDIEFPYTVPEGEVWVMGDNRTNSADSRWFGSVPVESVTGRVFFCYWPWDRIGTVE